MGSPDTLSHLNPHLQLRKKSTEMSSHFLKSPSHDGRTNPEPCVAVGELCNQPLCGPGRQRTGEETPGAGTGPAVERCSQAVLEWLCGFSSGDRWNVEIFKHYETPIRELT